MKTLKKIVVLLILTVFSINAFSQHTLPFVERFTSGSKPIGWSNIDNIGDGTTWHFNNPGNKTLTSTTSNTNQFAIFDSYYWGAPNINNGDLITPMIDMTTDSVVYLTFEHYFRAGGNPSSASVWISSDSGATWDSIKGWLLSTTATGSKDTINITSYAALQDSVLIKFKYRGSNSWYWAIDDIVIWNPVDQLKTVQWTSPLTGCGLSATSNITIRIKNEGLRVASNIPVSYSIDGGSTYINETISSTINVGDSLEYTFATTADFYTRGSYNCIGTVDYPNDQIYWNDTLTTIVQSKLENTFPYLEDFESGVDFWTTTGTSSSWELGTPAGTNISSAYSGANVWVTNLDGNYNISENSYLSLPCEFDLTTLKKPVIDFMLYMDSPDVDDYLDVEYSYGTVGWTKITTSDNNPSWFWYNEETAWRASNSGWTNKKASLAAAGGLSDVLLRFHFRSNITTIGEGFAIDDFRIYEYPEKDAGVIQMLYPITGQSCNSVGTIFPIIRVKNYGTDTLFSLPVKYSVNGGTTINETIIDTILTDETYDYTFVTATNILTPDIYVFNAWTELVGDVLPTDSCDSISVEVIATVSSFPYTQDFESGAGSWTSGGTNSSWELDVMNGREISTAYSGTNAWVTNNDSLVNNAYYNNSEVSWVRSPCFDFTSLKRPVINLKEYSDIDTSAVDVWGHPTYPDYASMQYSTNFGVTWNSVVENKPGQPNWDWYNHLDVSWANTSSGWLDKSTIATTLARQSNVMLRVRFVSDASIAKEGFAFDDVYIWDYPENDAGVVSFLAPSASANCDLDDSVQVQVRVKNYGADTLFSLPVNYRINGGSAVTETISDTIPPDGTYDYTFTTYADLSTAGLYDFDRAWTSLIGDTMTVNDSAIGNILLKHTTITSYPYFQDFDTDPTSWTPYGGTVNSTWELGTPSSDLIGAYSGSRCYKTNLDGTYDTSEVSYIYGPCLDFSSLEKPIFDFMLWEKSADINDYLDLEVAYGTVGWTSVTSTIHNNVNWSWYDVSNKWYGDSGEWKRKIATMPVLGGQNPVYIRYHLTTNNSTNNTGFAFDNFQIYEYPEIDVAVTDWILPVSEMSCSLSDTESVVVRVYNYGINDAWDIPVRFNYNSTTVSETITDTITTNEYLDYTFTTKVDMITTPGNYRFIYAWTDYAGDTMYSDSTDTGDSVLVISKPVISSYPYTQNFDGAESSWTVNGNDSCTWELGTPAGAYINTAGSGTKAWMTDLDGTYNVRDSSYVTGPCFDFSSLGRPIMEVNVNIDYEDTDYAVMEYSLNGGTSWTKITKDNSGKEYWNWYNYSDISWSNVTSVGTWSKKSTFLPLTLAKKGDVRFRMHFHSDASASGDGFAFDDIKIYDAEPYDAAVVAWSKPDTGAFCGLTNAEIKVNIKNYGSDSITNFAVKYKYNGTTICDTVKDTIAPGYTLTNYTFSTTVDMSTPGYYVFNRAWTELAGDTIQRNDSAHYHAVNGTDSSAFARGRVTSIETISSYPYSQNFDGGSFTSWTTSGTNSSWELGTPSSGITSTYSGANSWCTNLDGNYSVSEASYVTSPCFDFTSMTKPVVDLMLWMYSTDTSDYLDLEVMSSGSFIWKKLPNSNVYWDWYNASSSGNACWYHNNSGWEYKRALPEFDTLDLPGNSSVQFRVRFRSDADGVVNAGFAFDNFRVYDSIPAYDAGVLSIDAPTTCGLSTAEDVKIHIKNWGSETMTSCVVKYRINGGVPISETISSISLAYEDTLDYTFTTKANLATAGDYYFDTWTELAGDTFYFNDSVVGFKIVSAPKISIFPYEEDFDGGNHYWYVDSVNSINSSWELGTPAGAIIDAPSSSPNSWITNLTDMYNNNETSYVNSLCFDMSSLSRAIISLDIWYETDSTNTGSKAIIWDKAKLQSSINGGASWIDIGSGKTDFYNIEGEFLYWAGSNGRWDEVKLDTTNLEGNADVEFRVAFISDEPGWLGGGVYDGFAFDNFKIEEVAILSIKLIDFSATCKGDKVELLWTTASEVNNDFFTIEKSYNGINYEKVVVVDGSGNSNCIKNYKTNVNKDDDIIYYQIKSTDFDGNVEISSPIVVNCEEDYSSFDIYKAYLTENRAELIVQLRSSDIRNFNAFLCGNNGAKLAELKGVVEKGITEFKLNASENSNGIYMLIIQSEDKLLTRKILIY
jgi:hypothetical protein